MKPPYIILIFIILIFLLGYGNIKLKEKDISTSYVNIFLTISNVSNNSVSGTNVYFSSPPGRIIQGSTIITNNNAKTSQFKLSVQEEMASWISLAESSFSIDPGQQKAITLVIKIPQNAQGSYQSQIKIESILS